MIEFALVYMIGTLIINQDQTFENVNDCLYFARRLNEQPEIPYPNDELCFNIENQKQADKIVEIMSTCVPDLKVPFEVDMALCNNWGEVD